MRTHKEKSKLKLFGVGLDEVPAAKQAHVTTLSNALQAVEEDKLEEAKDEKNS